MKAAKSWANRGFRSAITTRSPPRSGGGLLDIARTIHRLEPRRLAQRQIDAPLPAGPARAEMGDDVAVEPERDELLGWRLLWSAPAVIRGDDLGSDFDSGTHARPIFFGQLERIGVAGNPRLNLGIFFVGHRACRAQCPTPRLPPYVL